MGAARRSLTPSNWPQTSAGGTTKIDRDLPDSDMHGVRWKFPPFSYVVRSRHDPVELLICGEISAGPQEYDTSPRLTIDSKRSRITIRPDSTSSLAQRQPEITFTS